jgi:Na+/melibiose symporter-like transporter
LCPGPGANAGLLAVGGYAASALAKLLLPRFADRVGKGARSAPRDALIAESVPAAVKVRDFAGVTIGALLAFLLAQLLFTLVNSSNQFLLLRSMGLEVSLPTVILMYLVFNLCASLASTPFGALSDRLGKKRVLLLGYSLYAAVYAAFAFIGPGSRWLLGAFWPLYGAYYAMNEGVEKAVVAGLPSPGSRTARVRACACSQPPAAS